MTAPDTGPGSLQSAAKTDDRVKALKALRDRLAAEIDDCDSKRDMASLSLRFMDVVEQIEELTGGPKPAKEPKETPASDFERRLREREAKAAHRSRTG